MITSTRHPLVRTFRRVAEHPRRDPERRIVLDGPRLIADALDAGVVIDAVMVAAGTPEGRVGEVAARLRASGARIHEAAPRVVHAAADVVRSQGIVALARRPEEPDDTLLARPDLILLVADGIQDPGNLGTMIRAAVAAGATAVAMTGASSDPWAPKALRATMGAAFRIPLLQREAAALCAQLRGQGTAIFAAGARAPLEYTAATLTPPIALVIGNESVGPDPLWASSGTGIRIPLFGPVESLNAAVAAAVLLYEVARRRGSAASPP